MCHVLLLESPNTTDTTCRSVYHYDTTELHNVSNSSPLASHLFSVTQYTWLEDVIYATDINTSCSRQIVCLIPHLSTFL